MLRKIIIPFIVVVCVVFCLPLSVWADAPTNIPFPGFDSLPDSSYSFSVLFEKDGVPVSVPDFDTLESGSVYRFQFRDNSGLGSVQMTLYYFVSSSDPFDVYVLCNRMYNNGFAYCLVDNFDSVPSPSSFHRFTGLTSSIYFPSGFPYTWYDFYFSSKYVVGSVSSSSMTFGNSSSQTGVTLCCFTCPPGSYCFRVMQGSNTDITFGLFTDLSRGATPDPPLRPIPEPSDSILQDYISGEISFTDATDQLSDLTDIDFSDSSNYELNLLKVAYAHYQLDYILSLSDLSVLQSVESDFVSELDAVKQSFLSGDTSILDAVSEYGSIYYEYLTKCNSVEEGTFLSSVYSLLLDELKYIYQINQDSASSPFDDTVSSDDQQRFDDADQAESDALAAFSLADFSASVDFDSWENRLDLVESQMFSSWLSAFATDTIFGPYVTIPLSLTVITILLATGLKGLSGSARSGGKHDERS